MAKGRMFDCGICLNRHFNGKCKSLLYPPAGNTCGWYVPPPDEHGESIQVREITTAASSLQHELSDVFPDLSLTNWIDVVGHIPSIRRASGASLRRRIRGVSTDEIVVRCESCGFDMDVDNFAGMVRGGRPATCTRCGSNDVSPGAV